MSTEMMRAVRFHSFGPPQVLVVDSIPRPPSPAEGQVLVRVRSAGVNPIDVAMRAGLVQNRVPISLPAIPGLELSGTIEEVGPGVTSFVRGQAVYANTLSNLGNGSNAEYVLAPIYTVYPMPSNIDFDRAATVTHGARTAWEGLFELGHLQPGQRILVQGGAGGVGIYVVQLAHLKGAHVIATASKENLKFVRDMGADEVIDYNETRFEDVVKDVDMVYDNVGGEIMDRSWQTLKKGGILVSAIGFPSVDTAEQWGVRCARVMLSKDLASILKQVTTLVNTGELKPYIREAFTMEQVVQAHTMCETRHGRGRIILHITD